MDANKRELILKRKFMLWLESPIEVLNVRLIAPISFPH